MEADRAGQQTCLLPAAWLCACRLPGNALQAARCTAKPRSSNRSQTGLGAARWAKADSLPHQLRLQIPTGMRSEGSWGNASPWLIKLFLHPAVRDVKIQALVTSLGAQLHATQLEPHRPRQTVQAHPRALRAFGRSRAATGALPIAGVTPSHALLPARCKGLELQQTAGEMHRQ